jgi:hypothetical protein
MVRKLFSTDSGTRIIVGIAAVIGLVATLSIRDGRTGTIVFLIITAIESGVFSLVYGLRSDWRQAPAARAVFWTVLAYFAVSAQLITMYLWETRYWWTYELRELLYLGLALAGLNLVLTLTRVLGPRVYRRRSAEAP